MVDLERATRRHFPCSTRRVVLSVLCAAWMIVFAVVHVCWALGVRFGLPAGYRVPGHLAMFVIDIVAIPLCLAGAVLAVAVAQPMAERFVRPVQALSWAMALLGLVHSIGNIVADLGMAFGLVAVPGSAYERITDFLFEPWWLLGGVLFALAALSLQLDSRVG